MRAGVEAGGGIGPSRWRGQRGRLEVWYATFTDARTGDGFWVHAELRAPLHGPPEVLGWAAWFPADGPPRVERFGPVPLPSPPGGDHAWLEVPGCRVGPAVLAGETPGMAWDLRWHDVAPPLFTFPAWAWERELLPASQVVLAPTASFTGTFRVGERVLQVDGRGALSRIYGHGSARRWGWLHADLGGGDVLEVVVASSLRPAFRPLGLLPFVKLRLDGQDWPDDPLLAALRLRGHVSLPRFGVEGRWGDRRLRVDAVVPNERAVALRYVDPDGRTATCTNSERASASIRLERRDGRGWALERAWTLDGTAHAEVGLRP